MDLLISQIGKFVSVGVLNTLVDIGFFNLFRRIKGFTATTASYASTTIAMIGSYFLNKSWTFASQGDPLLGAIKFFATTILGLYVIHNGIVFLLTKKIMWPSKLVLKIVRLFPFLKKMSDSFVVDNFAKVCAIAVTLVYNFLVYKFFVFAS